MSQTIVLGHAGPKKVYINIDVLLRTRLLVTADSGGGKTVLLKRLCEQIFGKVPIIIIDPEGEFSPLREKFGFVLVGPGGETPADPRSAGLVAMTLLKLKASAVCDIYEMKPSARHEWVKNFCDALIDAPKNLWHPTVIIVDEAHMFCPESKAGDSIATDSVKSLATRGRKRGLCPVYATQRLAEFNKGASSMCLNRLVGGTFEDVNQKRAIDVLSVTPDDKREFLHELKLLEPGYFFALGRAICTERTLVKIGEIETAHGDQALKYANEPPPAPEQIAKLLPKLADLPKAAEEKAKTEKELRSEIAELKRKARTASFGTSVVVEKHADPQAIKLAVREAVIPFNVAIRERDAVIGSLVKYCEGFFTNAGRVLNSLTLKPLSTPKISTGEINTKGDAPKNALRHTASVGKTNPRSDLPLPESPVIANGDVDGAMKKILTAMAKLKMIGRDSAPREMVAAWSGYSPNGGGFRNPISRLNVRGYISSPSNGSLSLTSEGEAIAGPQPYPDREEIKRIILDTLDGPESKILTQLLEHGEMTRSELAEKSGYTENGGGFRNPLSRLNVKRFIQYPRNGTVRASDWLFAE